MFRRPSPLRTGGHPENRAISHEGWGGWLPGPPQVQLRGNEQEERKQLVAFLESAAAKTGAHDW